MLYSNEKNNLQQAETSLELERGGGSQQHHRLQVCRQLEMWRRRKHTFRMLLWKGQGNGKGGGGGEGEKGELK
jgi:hypothetical protein